MFEKGVLEDIVTFDLSLQHTLHKFEGRKVMKGLWEE